LSMIGQFQTAPTRPRSLNNRPLQRFNASTAGRIA
jgi:hypothetical protein